MKKKCIEKWVRLVLAGIVCLLGLVFCFAPSSISQAATGDVLKTGTLTFNKTDKRKYSCTFDAPKDMSIVFEFKLSTEQKLRDKPIIVYDDDGSRLDLWSSSRNDYKTLYCSFSNIKKGTHTYTIEGDIHKFDGWGNINSFSTQYSIIDTTRYVSSITATPDRFSKYYGYDVNVDYSAYGSYTSYYYHDFELVTLLSSGIYATLEEKEKDHTHLYIRLHFNNRNNGGSITVLIRDKITGVQSEPLTISLPPSKSPYQTNVLEQEKAYFNKNQIETSVDHNVASVKIYRSNQENGTYTCIATVTPKRVKERSIYAYDDYVYVYKITYADKSVKANTRYYYKVACLENGYSEYGSLSEKAALFWTAPKRVSKKAKFKITGKGIWLTWKKVKGRNVRYAVKDTSPSKKLGKNIFGQTVYRSESTSYRKTKKCNMRMNEWNHYSRKIHSYVKRNGKYYSHGLNVSTVTFAGFGGQKRAY